MRRELNPHLLTVLVTATVSLAGLLGSAMPAAAQTAATRGALFDQELDTTLPAPSPLNQLFTSANDGWVHFPFAAADILPLLRSSTFNGTADVRGRSFTVATAASVDGYEGDIVSWDELFFGLSPSRDATQCDFGTVVAVVDSQTDPETLRFTDGSVQAWSRARYLIGSTRTPGAKLGHLRLAPDPFLAGKHLCMYRYAFFLEVNNGSALGFYDGQLSPIVVSAAPIAIDFAGSRSTPETVADEDSEPAEADEPEAEQEAEQEADPDGPEADDADADAAADEDVAAEESTTRSDPEVTDTDPDVDGPAADGGDTDGAEAIGQPTVPTPAETAPAADPDDDAVTAAAGEDVTAAPGDVADDDGGSGALVPTLAVLIAVLLAGIALVLVRGRRRDDRAAESTSVPADAALSDLGVADEGGAEGDAEAP